MNINRILVAVIVILLSYGTTIAQDPIYSQFYNAPMQLNPAFTGNFDAPLIAINYRNQWPLVQNAYNTYSVSYDQYFRKYHSGFGLFLLGDSAGDGALKTNKVSLVYSYRIKVNKDYRIKLGIESAFLQSSLNWDKLVFSDNLDPQYGSISPGGTKFPSSEVIPEKLRLNVLDLSSGMLLYSNQFYIGFSLKHMNNPTTKFLKETVDNETLGLPIRYSFHTGGNIELEKSSRDNNGIFLSPNLLITKQGDFLQINGGVYGQFDQLITGAWLRYAYHNIDAIILAAGWRYDIYKFVYSYDITVSKLGTSSGGAHELGIIINFNKIYPDKSRSIECFEVLR